MAASRSGKIDCIAATGPEGDPNSFDKLVAKSIDLTFAAAKVEDAKLYPVMIYSYSVTRDLPYVKVYLPINTRKC